MPAKAIMAGRRSAEEFSRREQRPTAQLRRGAPVRMVASYAFNLVEQEAFWHFDDHDPV